MFSCSLETLKLWMAESGDPRPGKNSWGVWWSGCVGDEASECSGIVKRSDSVFSHRNVCYQLHVPREQRRLCSGSTLLLSTAKGRAVSCTSHMLWPPGFTLVTALCGVRPPTSLHRAQYKPSVVLHRT